MRLLAGPAALAVVNLTTAAVLISNQEDGVYPSDGDSLGLPIGLTFVASLLALAAVGLMLGARRVIARVGSRNLSGRAASAVLAVSYVWVALFAFFGLLTWAAPRHYFISASYAVLLCWLAYEIRTEFVTRRGGANAV